jgi:hypothetical protein
MKTNRTKAEATREKAVSVEDKDAKLTAEGEKAAFLRNFGHDADYHVRFNLYGREMPVELGNIAEREIAEHRQQAAWLTYRSQSCCGWWFCSATGNDVSWKELDKALACLDKEGIDPHGAQVAELGYAWANTKGWAMESAAAEKFERVLAKLCKTTSHHWALELIRQDAYAALKMRLSQTRAAKPFNARRTNQARQKAIKLGTSWGWTSSAIAAALVLTGAERMDADRDFEAVKNEMRKAFGRFLKPSK